MSEPCPALFVSIPSENFLVSKKKEESQTMSLSLTVNEFREILGSEMHVDMDELVEASRRGIPEEVFLPLVFCFCFFVCCAAC